MPPKPKFTREEIVAAALELVSERGAEALTAKELGRALGSSASPIFTVFDGMGQVQQELRAAAMRRFEQFREGDLPPMPLFKRIGMKMVLFGVQEPKLYQLLFMQENGEAASFEDMFGELGETAELSMRALEQDYALSAGDAKRLFENMWIYTFGVGALCATRMCRFSEERLSEMLSTQFHALMLLLKTEKGEKK